MMVVVEMGPGVFMYVDVFMLMIVTNWCVVNTNSVEAFLKFKLLMMSHFSDLSDAGNGAKAVLKMCCPPL